MNQLKDKNYKEAKQYIRNALDKDFISDVNKQHLITSYNKLTEKNANEILRYIHDLCDDDCTNTSYKDYWYIINIIIHIIMSLYIFIIDDYMSYSIIQGSLYGKIFATLFSFILYSAIPTIVEIKLY